jgi:hypothetical protein
MMIYYDPDRYEGFSTSHTCEFHKANPGKVWAGCTCSGTFGTRKVNDEEYAKRRAERERREDDEILARAEHIRMKRAASGIETEGHDPKGHGAKHESPTSEAGDAQQEHPNE